MASTSRRWLAVAVLVVALALSPVPASADYCPTCYTACTFLDTFFVFCIPVEQGVTGYCHCKERPCYTGGTFCAVINVTP